MKKIGLLMIVTLLISGIGVAVADSSNLPWGFSWDTSLAEYIQFLDINYPEAKYRIKPNGDTQCIVTCNDRQKSISFEATFSVVGGIDRNVREYQADDLAGKTLRLESIGSVSLLAERQENRNSEMIDEFYKVYQEYADAFGGGDAELSYVTTNVSIDETGYYYIPDVYGRMDFERIKNYYDNQIASLRSYGIFLRNEHAQYRLNVYHVEGISADNRKIVGAISILFSRESQEQTGEKMANFP